MKFLFPRLIFLRFFFFFFFFFCYSNLISHIVRKESEKSPPSSTDSMVWEKLDAANLKAHNDSNWTVLETVLNAIGQFGR